MEVLLIVWASIMTIASVGLLVVWHPWNPSQASAPQADDAGLEQLWENNYRAGYNAGYSIGSSPEAVAERKSLLESKVVKQAVIYWGIELEGTLVDVSLDDGTIVLQEEGDNLTVYVAEGTIVKEWLEGGESKEIDITELVNYLGERLKVVGHIKGERLESEHINIGKMTATLN